MFCSHCGGIIQEEEKYCPNCGISVNSQDGGTFYSVSAPMGFSPKINDPAFAQYKCKAGIWSVLFALILAVIALIAFPIYGKVSGEIERPDSLLYGGGIGGMFLVIAFIQLMKRALDKTWDGTVEEKETYRQREGKDSTGIHTYYVVKVRKDSGGVKKHKWRDTPGLYDYYAVGDRVRHHKGFYCYEKYDKTRDAKIMCAACMTFVEKDRDVCPRCKCPLLK